MTKKCALYLGLKPPQGAVHYPMIRIVPLHPKISFQGVTHLIATSQTTLELIEPPFDLTVVAVGKKTASKAQTREILVAEEECAEGILPLLAAIDPAASHLLYPKSKRARPLIEDFLRSNGYRCQVVDLYDTVVQSPHPLPDLHQFDQVIFSSPSTVDAFFSVFTSPPATLRFHCQGKITEDYLTKKLRTITV